MFYLDYSRWKLRFGLNDLGMPRNTPEEEIRDILEVIVHPQYNKPEFSRYYDIAIIKIGPLIFNQNIRKVCLPVEAIDSGYRKHDIPATIIGWGAPQLGQGPTELVNEASVTIFQKRFPFIYPLFITAMRKSLFHQRT